MQIGIIGLGKMGMQIARRLHKKGFKVLAWNRSLGPRKKLKRFFKNFSLAQRQSPSPPSSPPISGERNKRRGGKSAVFEKISDLVSSLPRPKIIWVMLPAAETDKFVIQLSKLLSKGDTIIDGSNSFYLNSIKTANKLARYKIWYFDVGVSGGIHGEKNGFSLMIGGNATVYKKIRPIFRDLAAGDDSYGLVGKAGTGHFVKMIHNGIEYGMMETIAEGFAVLNKWNPKIDLVQVTKIWQNGSVIRSWLLDLCQDIFGKENFSKVVGIVKHTGEGEWTVKVGKKIGVDVRVIEDALKVRKESKKIAHQKLFRNKLLALLRNRFGGHEVTRRSGSS